MACRAGAGRPTSVIPGEPGGKNPDYLGPCPSPGGGGGGVNSRESDRDGSTFLPGSHVAGDSGVGPWSQSPLYSSSVGEWQPDNDQPQVIAGMEPAEILEGKPGCGDGSDLVCLEGPEVPPLMDIDGDDDELVLPGALEALPLLLATPRAKEPLEGALPSAVRTPRDDFFYSSLSIGVRSNVTLARI